MHFDLVDLRLMVKIAESNSLTKGAESVHISLPAASTRLKNLEESIGTKLLYRTSQGMTLTPPGQALIHHARLVLGQIEQLRGDLQEYAAGIKGHLRVFANSTALGEFLPPVLRSYLLSHPDVNIDLRERLSPDIVKAVSDSHTDIGIVAGNVATETLQAIPYRKDRLVLVVPAGHELEHHEAIDFVQTLEYDYVGLHETSAVQAFLIQVCEKMNRSLKMRIRVSNFEAACRMIEATVGIGVMPGSAARRHAETLDIRLVPLNDEWALRTMMICVRDLSALPLFARDLVDLLVADAAASDAEHDR